MQNDLRQSVHLTFQYLRICIFEVFVRSSNVLNKFSTPASE